MTTQPNPGGTAPGRPPQALLTQTVREQAPLLRKALFFSMVIAVLILAPTFYMLEVYDRVVNSRSHTTLLMLTLLVIGVYVVMELLDSVRAQLLRIAAFRVDASLRQRLFDGVYAAKLAGRPGSPMQAFADLRVVRDFMYSPPAVAMLDAPGSLLFLLILFVVSPWLGVMALLGALIQLIIVWRTEKRTMPELTEAGKASTMAQAYAAGTFRNAQVIQAMGMTGSLEQRWADLQRKFLIQQAQASDHAAVNIAGNRFLQLTQGSLILGASCWLTLKGGMLGGGGMMIVASALGSRVLSPVGQLVMQWQNVVNARNAFARLNAGLESSRPAAVGMPLPAPAGRVNAENLYANAPITNTPILRGVSFSLEPGEVLVVVGPSAAGKTSLARVLMGIWPCNIGKVRLDGADIYTWNKDEVGPYLGYLPQSVELFDGAIADNIARFGDVDMAAVRQAAQAVGLLELIESMPEGFDSRIGEDGAKLSGGQRQRLGLARAIYRHPKFLVLDEPNSNLDDEGERQLLDVVRQLKAGGSTIVLISHRVSVLPVADKMLVLRDGQVVVFGPRDEVLGKLQQAAQASAAPRMQVQGGAA